MYICVYEDQRIHYDQKYRNEISRPADIEAGVNLNLVNSLTFKMLVKEKSSDRYYKSFKIWPHFLMQENSHPTINPAFSLTL